MTVRPAVLESRVARASMRAPICSNIASAAAKEPAAPLLSPRSLSASPSRVRVVAISYGTSSACQRSSAARRLTLADRPSRSASHRRPRAVAAVACSRSVSYSAATTSSSSTEVRAASSAPAAIAICTWAGRSLARPSRLGPAPSRQPPMMSSAVSTRPWARRSNADPGQDRPHSSSARANAASAPSRSPSRRRMSPVSANAAPALGRWIVISSVHARSASRSASTSSPRQLSALARWTRQTPGNTANGWPPVQRAVASVHSEARA